MAVVGLCAQVLAASATLVVRDLVALAFLVVGGQVLALLAASARLVVRDLVALAFLVVGGLGPGPVACCLLPVACCLLRSPVAGGAGWGAVADLPG